MNINVIRKEIQQRQGEILHFKFNGSRNQIEDFKGRIIQTYPAIFLVRLEDQNSKVKSFSYNDLVMESLEIINETSCI